jgi:hypothetical protein
MNPGRDSIPSSTEKTRFFKRSLTPSCGPQRPTRFLFLGRIPLKNANGPPRHPFVALRSLSHRIIAPTVALADRTRGFVTTAVCTYLGITRRFSSVLLFARGVVDQSQTVNRLPRRGLRRNPLLTVRVLPARVQKRICRWRVERGMGSRWRVWGGRPGRTLCYGWLALKRGVRYSGRCDLRSLAEPSCARRWAEPKPVNRFIVGSNLAQGVSGLKSNHDP